MQRDPFNSFLHDSLRNGTLLCTLIGMLDKHRASRIPRSKVYRDPATIVQARSNVELALRTLIRRGHKEIPAPYLLQTEEVLKGNRAVIWGLLYHMKMTFKAPKGFHTGSGSPRKLPKVGCIGWCLWYFGPILCIYDLCSWRFLCPCQCPCLTSSPKSFSQSVSTMSEQVPRSAPTTPGRRKLAASEEGRLEKSLLSWVYSVGALEDVSVAVSPS